MDNVISMLCSKCCLSVSDRIMFKILFSYKSIILIYIHVSDIDIVLLFCCDHFYDLAIKFNYISIMTINCYIHVCLIKKTL